MFAECSSLTAAPLLAAAALADNCYNAMFSNCVSLSTVPSRLDPNAVEVGCYDSMFINAGQPLEFRWNEANEVIAMATDKDLLGSWAWDASLVEIEC